MIRPAIDPMPGRVSLAAGDFERSKRIHQAVRRVEACGS